MIAPTVVVRLLASPLATAFGRYPSVSMVPSTFFRVAGLTFGLPFTTRETVAIDTFASRATSYMVTFIVSFPPIYTLHDSNHLKMILAICMFIHIFFTHYTRVLNISVERDTKTLDIIGLLCFLIPIIQQVHGLRNCYETLNLDKMHQSDLGPFAAQHQKARQQDRDEPLP
jgi:hypothetical protein